jgi:hypothetical protein
MSYCDDSAVVIFSLLPVCVCMWLNNRQLAWGYPPPPPTPGNKLFVCFYHVRARFPLLLMTPESVTLEFNQIDLIVSTDMTKLIPVTAFPMFSNYYKVIHQQRQPCLRLTCCWFSDHRLFNEELATRWRLLPPDWKTLLHKSWCTTGWSVSGINIYISLL